MPPDTSVIRIDEIAVYTTVRVTLASPSNFKLFNFLPSIKGLFRQRPGREAKTTVSLQPRSFNRIVGFNRRKIFGSVTENNTVDKLLSIEVQNPPHDPEISLSIIIPYKRIFRLARLVHGANPLSEEDEAIRRRKHLGVGSVSNSFIHPFDRFIPVKLIALS